MKQSNRTPIAELLGNPSVVQEALRRAYEAVVRQHAQAGLPMATWQDGKVVWVSATDGQPCPPPEPPASS